MADLKSRRRARRLADERNLAGFANDTKWGEFFQQVESLRIPVEVKLLYEDEPTRAARMWIPVPNYLESVHGPELYVFIEWVRSADSDHVSRIATIVGLEFSVEHGKVTVYGYK